MLLTTREGARSQGWVKRKHPTPVIPPGLGRTLWWQERECTVHLPLLESSLGNYAVGCDRCLLHPVVGIAPRCSIWLPLRGGGLLHCRHIVSCPANDDRNCCFESNNPGTNLVCWLELSPPLLTSIAQLVVSTRCLGILPTYGHQHRERGSLRWNTRSTIPSAGKTFMLYIVRQPLNFALKTYFSAHNSCSWHLPRTAAPMKRASPFVNTAGKTKKRYRVRVAQTSLYRTMLGVIEL